jgi:hypothetical protein
MDSEEVLRLLGDSATKIGDLAAPAAPGVYAYFLRGFDLPGISNPGDGPIYIGLSSNLAQREFDTHFAEGQTGFSTLRRSIGAILKEELGLRARPRGTGASETNFRNYRFDNEGERRLSEWMRRSLLVGVQAVPEPKALEDELITVARPPLNLKGWANPEAAGIKALRKACVNEARRQHPRS